MTRWNCFWPLLALGLACSSLGCSGTDSAKPAATQPAERPSGPRADFRSGTTLDAGEVDYARSRDFPFLVNNTGGAPLTLKLAKKSCSCADVKLPDEPIAPGGEGKVEIRWAPIPGNSGKYDVTATVETNDPLMHSVQLTVHTFIKPLVHIFIEGREENSILDFGDAPILPGKPRSREVKVFSTELPSFTLDPRCPVEGVTSEKKAMRAGDRVGKYEVRSGYTLDVTAKDTLPLGYLRTSLDLALRDLGDQPDRTVTIPVYAVVGSGAFSVEPAVFRFRKARITDEDTARVNLTIDAAPDMGAVTVDSWTPKFLKVDAPEKRPSGKWLIVVHIPKNNPEAAKYQPDSFMEGQVVLKVSGIARPVTIRVKWEPLGE